MEEAQRRHESYAVRIGRRAATRSGVSFAVYAGTKVYAKLQKPRNGERPARRGGPTGPSNVEACDPGPRGLQSGISLFDTVYTFPRPDAVHGAITQDHAPRPRWPLRPPPRAPLRFSSSSRAQWDAEEPRIEL